MMPARVDGGGGLKPLDQLRERRRQMAHRRRRIIFNNYGDEISFEGVNTREQLLASWDYLPSQRDESDVLPVVRLTRYRRPLRVTSAGAEPILVFAGEDFAAPTPGGARREIELLVHVADIAECQQLLVTLNGVTLEQIEIPGPSDDGQAATFRSRPDPRVLAPGENRLDVRVVGDGAEIVDDVRFQVRFEPDSNSGGG